MRPVVQKVFKGAVLAFYAAILLMIPRQLEFLGSVFTKPFLYLTFGFVGSYFAYRFLHPELDLDRVHLPSRSPTLGFLTGILGGLVLLGIVYLLSHILDGGPPRTDITGMVESLGRLGTYAILILVTPLVEELFYRKFLTEVLLPISPWFAIVIQAILFGLAHQKEVAPVLVFIGLVFGWLRIRFGLLSSVTAHVVYNSMILLYANL